MPSKMFKFWLASNVLWAFGFVTLLIASNSKIANQEILLNKIKDPVSGHLPNNYKYHSISYVVHDARDKAFFCCVPAMENTNSFLLYRIDVLNYRLISPWIWSPNVPWPKNATTNNNTDNNNTNNNTNQ